MARVKPPVDRPNQIQPFTPQQVGILLATAKNTLHPKRDMAILSLLYETSLRASELCGLRLTDVSLSERAGDSVTVRHGKGGKMRKVAFTNETRRVLFDYLRDRAAVYGQEDEDAPLFMADRGDGAGGILGRHGLRFLFYRLGKASGLGGVRCSPPTMRHSFAVEFLRQGG